MGVFLASAVFAADRSPAPVTNLELQGKITGASSLRSLRGLAGNCHWPRFSGILL